MVEARREFYNLEELLKPREIFITDPGNEAIEKEIERFFGSVLHVLGYTEEELEAFVERKTQVLHNYDKAGVMMPTDDRITLLFARNRVVATVLETRDDLNYIQVSPAAYLNPQMINGIGGENRKK